ncbi:hypothetical protein U1Q18_026498 [Sarracenia purpurea var. burkii]
MKDLAFAVEGFSDCVEITGVADRRLRFDEIQEKKAVTDSVGDENREVVGAVDLCGIVPVARGSGSLIGVSAGGGRVLAVEVLCSAKNLVHSGLGFLCFGVRKIKGVDSTVRGRRVVW